MAEDLPHATAGELTAVGALARVPGYRAGDPSVRTVQLAGGSVNRSFRVTTAGGSFIVRLSSGVDAWLESNRAVEQRLHRIAAAAGLAPRIVAADVNDRWLITEYAEGRLWDSRDFGEPEQLATLARTLGRLHALPAPDTGRFALLEILRNYADRLQGTGLPGLPGYLQRAAQAWAISGADTRPRAIVHHDLNAANIIERANGLTLIDWECAAVGDPLQDIACILSYYDTAAVHSRLLLEHSGLGHITHAELAASLWLFDLHTYFWYCERRSRLTPTAAELAAERRLAARLEWPPRLHGC